MSHNGHFEKFQVSRMASISDISTLKGMYMKKVEIYLLFFMIKQLISIIIFIETMYRENNRITDIYLDLGVKSSNQASILARELISNPISCM